MHEIIIGIEPAFAHRRSEYGYRVVERDEYTLLETSRYEWRCLACKALWPCEEAIV